MMIACKWGPGADRPPPAAPGRTDLKRPRAGAPSTSRAMRKRIIAVTTPPKDRTPAGPASGLLTGLCCVVDAIPPEPMERKVDRSAEPTEHVQLLGDWMHGPGPL
jgi:hypothetical protein